MSRVLLWAATLALLTGCGSVTRLRPQEGMGEVPKAEAAQERATPTELMKPSTQAQPDRQADLLLKSSERKDDPFDLPPGRENGRAGD